MSKWSKILGIKMPFSKQFLICNKHFERKCLLQKHSISPNSKVRLSQNAIPCRNLPRKRTFNSQHDTIFSNETESAVTEETESEEAEVFPRCGESDKDLERTEDKLSHEREEIFEQDKENEEVRNIHLCSEKVQDEEWLEIDEEEEDWLDLGEGQKWLIKTIEECKYNSIGIQCRQEVRDKEVQVNIKPCISIPSLWDTDRKLNTMTGISRMKILNVLVEICRDIRPNEKCFMSLEDRICLTMYKLKSNCSFAEVAVLFQVTDPTAKLYFADTIQLLAKAMKGLIHWQTKEQNKRSLPKCFKRFPNVRTVLDCTEIKTATLNCLSCRVSTYSHYKGTHTLKFLIGVSPSGSINYISKVVTGKSSDKAIFNLTDLIISLTKVTLSWSTKDS